MQRGLAILRNDFADLLDLAAIHPRQERTFIFIGLVDGIARVIRCQFEIDGRQPDLFALVVDQFLDAAGDEGERHHLGREVFLVEQAFALQPVDFGPLRFGDIAVHRLVTQ